MTIEQEIKLQARHLAQDMAKNMAHGIAKDMAQGIAKDMAQDIANKKTLETAKKMLENNIPAEIVAKCTGLEISQLDKLKQS